jgi:hypothetical protein
MSKTRDTGFLGNIVKVDTSGNVSFVSGSTTLATINTSGQLSGSSPVLSSSYASNAELLDGLDSTVFTLTSSFNAQTASFNAFSASILTYTGSANNRFSSLETTSGSNITRLSALEAATGSLYSYTSSLNNKTASFATTGSNTFIGTQTISGSVLQSGSFTTTGTIIAQTINVQQVTSSIIYSSGSNIFGNLLNNTQTFTGSMLITGSTLGVYSNTTCFYGNSYISSSGIACFAGTVCTPSIVTNTVSTVGTALTPTAACLGYGIFGYSGVGLGIASSANGPNQGMGFFVCGDVERMRIITSGNVGIGTVCPSYLLDVNGTGRFSSTLAINMGASTADGLFISRTSSTANGMIKFNSASADKWIVGLRNTSDDDFHIYSYAVSTDVFKLASTGAATFSNTITGTTIYGTAVCSPVGLFSGCVGIGTNSPQRPLEIRTGGSNTTPSSIFFGSATQVMIGGEVQIAFSSNISPSAGIPTATELARAGIGFQYLSAALPSEFSIGIQCTNVCNSNVKFWNGVERMRITSGGSIVVGNAAYAGTTTDLSITGDKVNSDGYYSRLIFQNSNQSGGSSASIRGERVSSNFATDLTFYTNCTAVAGEGSERMRITSGGQTQFIHSTSELDILYARNGSASPYGMNITFTAASPNNGSNNFLYLADSTTLRFAARSNGGLSNFSGNNVNLASDIRLKKDISPLSSEWDKLKQIEVVNFKYKDSTDETALYGAIAQQVQEIYPNLVIVTREATETEPEYYGLREQPFQWLTTKVLQEAMAKIETQQCTICSQASMINTLKTCLGIA